MCLSTQTAIQFSADALDQTEAATPQEPRPAVVCDGMTMGRTALELELEVADVLPDAAREKASLSLSLAERMLDMVGPEEESVDLPDRIAFMFKEEDDDIGLVLLIVCVCFFL